MQTLNVDAVLDKGLGSEADLSDLERSIFVVAYFESISDMEGWDHFFTYSLKWYPDLQRALEAAGDLGSLKVLRSYETHLSSLGVPLDAESIDTFLTKASTEYFDSCPDWREQFSEKMEERWKLISAHYSSIGVQLET